MAEYLTVNDRALDSTGSGGIEGLGLRMVGGYSSITSRGITITYSGFKSVYGVFCCLKNNNKAGYTVNLSSYTNTSATFILGGKDPKEFYYLIIGEVIKYG